MVKKPPAMQETQVRSLSQEDAPEGAVAIHSSIGLTAATEHTHAQHKYSNSELYSNEQND